jgi:hypothetical protein
MSSLKTGQITTVLRSRCDLIQLISGFDDAVLGLAVGETRKVCFVKQ